MERAAFKIPLRPNPSTLPNVFPTILHEHEAGPLPKQTEKLFFFLSFFKRARALIWSICARVPGGQTGWVILCFCWPTEMESGSNVRAESRHTAFFLLSVALNKAIKVASVRTVGMIGFRCPSCHPHQWDSRRYVLCGDLSTVWAQTGFPAVSGIWIETE